METILFLTVYFTIIFSILGYGLFFAKLINADFFQLNYGYLGLFGVCFLVFVSYATHLFFSHGYIHNIIIHSVGILFFFFFHTQLKKNSSKELKILIFVFLIFLIAIFLSKNNEDFPYYHFPYVLHLVQNKLQFGQGWFQSGYRHHSSLLYFNSLFYLPRVEYYLFTSSNLIIFSFVNLILFKNIFNKKNLESFNFIFILNLFSLVYLVTIFNRLADFGTDKAGQAIVFVLAIMFLEILNKKNEFKEIKKELQILIILLLLLITLKIYFLIYTPLVILLLVHLKDKFKYIRIIFFSRITIFGFFLLLLFGFLNVANNGCTLYPIASTCFFDVFPWSVDKDTIGSQRYFFELWSKGGAGPGFRIENPEIYIQKLNWFTHWIDYYFFNKVSDLIAALLTICILFLILFLRKKKIIINDDHNYKRKYKIIYTFFFAIFLYWFFEHPTLRYGGYCIIALVVFIPLSLRLELSNLTFNIKQYGSLFLIIIALSIFISKNFIRINKEFNRTDQYQYKNFPYYYVDKRLLQRVVDEPKGLKKTIVYGYEIFSPK